MLVAFISRSGNYLARKGTLFNPAGGAHVRPTKAALAPLAINLMNSIWLFRAPNSRFADGQLLPSPRPYPPPVSRLSADLI